MNVVTLQVLLEAAVGHSLHRDSESIRKGKRILEEQGLVVDGDLTFKGQAMVEGLKQMPMPEKQYMIPKYDVVQS